MLLRLRDFIARQKIVSTQQLTREFQLDLQALLPMLQWWEHKGVLRPCEQKACKSACLGCKPRSVTYYQYVS